MKVFFIGIALIILAAWGFVSAYWMHESILRFTETQQMISNAKLAIGFVCTFLAMLIQFVPELVRWGDER